MSRFTMTHEIKANEESFWKQLFDKDSSTQLHVEGLGYKAYEIIAQEENGAQLTRKVLAQPRMTLPGPVMKLMGSNYQYSEEGRFDKRTKVWSAKLTPNAHADKILQEYTLRLEPAGVKSVRRIVDYVFEAKIFGIGGLMESSFEKQLRDEFDLSATILNAQLGA